MPDFRIKSVDIIAEDENGNQINFGFEVDPNGSYGWEIEGKTVYPRYVNLMASISDFMKMEKAIPNKMKNRAQGFQQLQPAMKVGEK
jgi:hypothetical protein